MTNVTKTLIFHEISEEIVKLYAFIEFDQSFQ